LTAAIGRPFKQPLEFQSGRNDNIAVNSRQG
jgi:hypothetical protein